MRAAESDAESAWAVTALLLQDGLAEAVCNAEAQLRVVESVPVVAALFPQNGIAEAADPVDAENMPEVVEDV